MNKNNNNEPSPVWRDAATGNILSTGSAIPKRTADDELARFKQGRTQMQTAKRQRESLIVEDIEIMNPPTAQRRKTFAASATSSSPPLSPRPAQGSFDHVIPSPAPVSIKRIPALPILSIDHDPTVFPSEDAMIVDDLKQLDRHAIPRLDGTVINLSDSDSKELHALINNVPDHLIENLLNNWNSPSHRQKLIGIVRTLSTQKRRHEYLQVLLRAAKQTQERYGSEWEDAEVQQHINKWRDSRFRFAVRVAEGLGRSVEQVLISSDIALQQSVRATLQERSAALKAIGSMVALYEASLDALKDESKKNDNNTTIMFDRVMPGGDMNLRELESELRAQDAHLTTRVISQLTATSRDDVIKSIEDKVDIILPQRFTEAMKGVGSIYPGIYKSALALIQTREAKAPAITPDTFSSSEALNFLEGNLLPSMIPWLVAAVQLMAVGTHTESTNQVEETVGTLLSREVRQAARIVYAQTKEMTQTTRGKLEKPIVTEGSDATKRQHSYWPLSPPTFGLYYDSLNSRAQAYSLADADPGQGDPLVLEARRQLNQLAAVLGNTSNSGNTWQNVQLSFRTTNSANNFISRLETRIEAVTERDGGGGKDGRLFTATEGADLIKLVSKMRTGASLSALSRDAGDWVKKHHDPAASRAIGKFGLSADIFAGTIEANAARLEMDTFNLRWEPALLVDIRFSVLTLIVRYQLLRTLLLEVNALLDRYANRQLSRVEEKLEAEREKQKQLTLRDIVEPLNEARAGANLRADRMQRTVFSDGLNNAIHDAIHWILELTHINMREDEIRSDLWIEPKPEWGSEATQFSLVFAEAVIHKLTPRGITGVYHSTIDEGVYQSKLTNILSKISNRRIQLRVDVNDGIKYLVYSSNGFSSSSTAWDRYGDAVARAYRSPAMM